MGIFDKWKKPEELTTEQLIEKVVAQTVTNATSQEEAAAYRQRLANTISGGPTGADTLHNIFLDFGYPDSVDFYNFWNMYRRFGIAKNIVELPVDTTWMKPPKVESDSERFENDVEKMINDMFLWQRLKGLDTRQRVGRYAGMFMRVRDGQSPDKPIEGKLNGLGSLAGMIPLYEGQLQVTENYNIPTEDRYGLPKMYQYQGGNVGNRNERVNESFAIHPDRIIIAAEGADNGGIYGIPSLEAPFNSLMDLRKIIGAGGEGFYKNAAQSIIFKLMDAASASDNADLLGAFNDNADDFMQNRSRRSLWTPGMDATTLDSNLAQPQQFFMAALNDVAAACKIPATVLIGQQTGRLASTEDSKSFLSSINSRREGFTTELVTCTLDWCIKYGILENAEYEVEMCDLLAASDSEMLENAVKMADVNAKQYQSGGSVPFTGIEIREAAGHDPEPEIPEEGEGLPGNVEDDDVPPEDIVA